VVGGAGGAEPVFLSRNSGGVVPCGPDSVPADQGVLGDHGGGGGVVGGASGLQGRPGLSLQVQAARVGGQAGFAVRPPRGQPVLPIGLGGGDASLLPQLVGQGAGGLVGPLRVVELTLDAVGALLICMDQEITYQYHYVS